jgi:GT2 family glycosyltransferase
MLSIVMAARNVQELAANCLRSLLAAVASLGIESQVEYLLVDDASEPGREVAPLMVSVRGQTRAPVRVLRFTARQHYTRALAHAFSIVQGQSILFISHDMIVTPAYIRTLLAVAALDPSFGIIRGTSNYVDCFPNHVIKPSPPTRTVNDASPFAEHMAAYHGLTSEEDPFLTGDSMLIQPGVLAKVGVFDPRYYGYFGDIDYGLRVQRAGFKLICAKGAWLLHKGAAYYKDEAAGGDLAPVHAARMQVVDRAYMAFREKWDLAMPPNYPGAPQQIDLARLRTVPSPVGGEFQPPIPPSPTICEML